MTDKTPSEIARDAFKLLATRRLAPTPENYSAIYHELAGTKPGLPPQRAFSTAFSRMRLLEERNVGDMEQSLLNCDWDRFFKLLKQAIEHAAPAALPPVLETAEIAERSLTDPLREQLARTIEFGLPALGEDDQRVLQAANQLIAACRSTDENVPSLTRMLSAFNHRLSFAAEDQNEIRHSLLALLRLIFENIGKLSLDDRWLHAQIEALMQASEPPLNLRRLEDLHRRLKDVIFKQSELKARTIAAQEEMKLLLASFLERLSSMAELSSDHHRKMEACVRKIETATAISDLAPVIQEALSATRMLSFQAERNRDELNGMRLQAQTAAAEAEQLRKTLDQVSASARHDMLTGALNRRGLEEALAAEIARATRDGSSLAIGFLDIDNFKAINDVHGHGVGDEALTHLTQVLRECIRPHDTLSRFGGEEFVILMPDTSLEDAIHAMQRVQRELTRKFFMADNARLFITFSAGVTQLGTGESPEIALERADRAMYQAKRTGKNKVVGV